jgi:hypothetical protein
MKALVPLPLPRRTILRAAGGSLALPWFATFPADAKHGTG